MGAIRHKLVPLARSCRDAGMEVEFVAPPALEAAIPLEFSRIISSEGEIYSSCGISSELDYHLYKDGKDSALSYNLSKYYKELLNSPDVIFAWENCCYHLELAFPEATIINLMPGMVSRTPYPDLVYFDVKGLFKDSLIYSDVDRILDQTIPTVDELAAIRDLKNKAEQYFLSMDRVDDVINAHTKGLSASGIALIPLQYSKHYNFRVDTPYESQSEFLADALNHIGKDKFAVVTQYITKGISDEAVSDEYISYLHKSYPNVIFDQKFNEIDSISQYILPRVDDVVACSSSIAFQALLFNKKVRLLHDTFISKVVDRARISDEYRERILVHLLFRSSVVFKNLLDPSFMAAFIAENVRSRRADDAFDIKRVNSSYISDFVRALRFDRAQEQHARLRSGRGKSFISASVQKAVLEAEVVSFDVFDTLIERPLAQPSDLFKIVERKIKSEFEGISLTDFSRMRMEAEQISKARLAEGVEDVTLDNIYDTVFDLSGLDRATVDRIKRLELDVERSLLTARPIGKAIYNFAVKCRKKIIYASDMYLPHEFIKEALEANGYAVSQNLYLSCAIGKKKRTGSMFGYILDDLQIDKEGLVHFGDNAIGDERIPKELGIRAYRIARAVDKMRAHASYKGVFEYGSGQRSLEESVFIYLIARRLFDNPFSPPSSGGLFDGSPFVLGYAGLGPCVADFALWLNRRVKANKNDGLFFIARDGKIINEIYDILFPESCAKTNYIFGSRLLLRKSFPPSRLDVYSAIGPVMGQKPSVLLKRWYDWEAVNPAADEPAVDDISVLKAHEIISGEVPFIQKRNDANQETFRRYASKVGINDCANPAIVEIGYAGTIQEGYQRATGVNIGGYYFVLFDTALARVSDQLPMEGYVSSFSARSRIRHSISNNGFLYETLFCSDEGTIVGLNERDGVFTALREDNIYDSVRRSFIKKVHAGARAFASDLADVGAPIIELLEHNPVIGSVTLDRLMSCPTKEDASLFEGVIFSNNVEGGFEYVVPPERLRSAFVNGKVRCIWPDGAKVFYGQKVIKSAGVDSVKSEAKSIRSGVGKRAKAVNSIDELANIHIERFRGSGNLVDLRLAAEYCVLGGEREKAIRYLKEARRISPRNRRLLKRLIVLQWPWMRALLGENRFSLESESGA